MISVPEEEEEEVASVALPTQTSLWEVLDASSVMVPHLFDSIPQTKHLEGAIPACLEQCVGMRAESYS